MTAQSIAFLGWLCREFPVLMPILADHLVDQEGEILANLLMGDITRWLVQNYGRNPVTVNIIAQLELAYVNGEETGVSELIAVSFLENLPRAGEPKSEIRECLGRNMQKQLSQFG